LAGLAQRGDQLGGADRHRSTVFVFQFDAARAAVAGQVQHVVGVRGQGAADFFRVTHFQNAHLRIAVLRRWFDGVEQVAQFPFVVKRDAGAAAFVRCADGDQDFQRAG
jgi:hypothetical protein